MSPAEYFLLLGRSRDSELVSPVWSHRTFHVCLCLIADQLIMINDQSAGEADTQTPVSWKLTDLQIVISRQNEIMRF